MLLATAGVLVVIFSTEPKARRTTATRETPMLVDVTRVERGSFRPTIEAMGTVRPERDVILSPRVGGQIVERAKGFAPGGFVEKGETLLKIDPADYETALAQRRSDLHRAVGDLELEFGRQEVARQDYELLGEEIAPQDQSLVLREPQLNTAQANVEAAEAAVRRGELDLERTNIKAPFDAHILSREVDVGSQVAPGDRLGRLVGVDRYWVTATVPLSQLRWIVPPESGNAGADVRIRDRSAWPEGEFRMGNVDGIVGALEEQTRLARVLVTVPDPLARETPDKSALIIGAFVEAQIEAEEIADVIRLDRDYLRGNDTVWIMEHGELRIRDVEIVFRDVDYAYIESGLNEGDRVVTTNLATVVEGARLRVEE